MKKKGENTIEEANRFEELAVEKESLERYSEAVRYYARSCEILIEIQKKCCSEHLSAPEHVVKKIAMLVFKVFII